MRTLFRTSTTWRSVAELRQLIAVGEVEARAFVLARGGIMDKRFSRVEPAVVVLQRYVR